jgi:glycosyltransferase involved in cell wall biosynthesis
MISVIFPVKNEEGNVEELYGRTKEVLATLKEPFEIIIVDDGSTDGTLEKIKKLSPVKIIVLARNYGQSLALDAGIRAAAGDIVVIMDADLQNDPTDIPKLLQKMEEGYDVVVGWRKDRHDSFGRKIFSRLANLITRSIAGLNLHDFGCALRAFRSEHLKNIRLYGVMHVFIPVILAGQGARVTEVAVAHHERRSGISKYSFIHMASDFADILTIKFLYGYASRPLLFFGIWALVSFSIGFLAIIASIVIKFAGILGFSQTPLPILATLFIILGTLLFVIGFLTELLMRIYYETRNVTPYQIKKIIENK